MISKLVVTELSSCSPITYKMHLRAHGEGMKFAEGGLCRVARLIHLRLGYEGNFGLQVTGSRDGSLDSGLFSNNFCNTEVTKRIHRS